MSMPSKTLFIASCLALLYSDPVLAQGTSRQKAAPGYALNQSDTLPFYALTKKQLDFIEKSGTNDYIRKNSSMLFENAANVMTGSLTGYPLQDMLKIMDEKGMLPKQADADQLSLKYGITKDEIMNAFGIYGLEVIDGKPEFSPTPNGLAVLKKTGIKDFIDKSWEHLFTEEKKEELRKERQSGKKPSLLRLVLRAMNYSGGENGNTLKNYLNSEDKKYNSAAVLGTTASYIDNKLFEEIPQKYKLARHQNTLK